MKIDVAVCDDSVIELKVEEAMLRRYGEKRRDAEMSVSAFLSSEEFVKSLRSGRHYDICVLDMLMPKHNGMDVGRVIRRQSMSTVIIYITSSPDYALDAFGVFAEQYLIKPVSVNNLYAILDRIFDRFVPAVADVFSVKTRDAVISLRCGDIVYVENAGRFMKFHMTDGRVIESAYMRGAFAEQMRPLLERGEFVQTHKSFVANMGYFTSLGAAAAETKFSETVPVSRRLSVSVRRKYAEFSGGR